MRRRCFLFSPTPIARSTFHYRKTRLVPEDVANPLERPTLIDKGTLHVVSVPIGNLKDFTYRAIDVLKQVDYIITTNRPATKTLLDLVHIPNQGRLIHYSPHNQSATAPKLVEMLQSGQSMALVSTSGTPCVGDVGGELVQAMHQSGVRVTSVPGASAVLAALTCCGETSSVLERGQIVTGGAARNSGLTLGGSGGSGSSSSAPECSHSRHAMMKSGGSDSSVSLSSDSAIHGLPFYFGNILPKSQAARLRILRCVVHPAPHVCLFYEFPRRLLTVLEDIAYVMPTRRVYITHELTKLNESMHADRADRLMSFYRRNELNASLLKQGQLVIAIAGCGNEHKGGPDARKLQAGMRRLITNRIAEAAIRDLRRACTEGGVDDAPKSTSSKKCQHETKKRKRYRKRLRTLKKIALEQEKLRLLSFAEHESK